MTKQGNKQLTPEARFFLEPTNPNHRQYEALRARFVDGRPSREVAAEFGYRYGSFRNLCCEFREDLTRQFFLPTQRGLRKVDEVRQRIIAMRKRNFSVHEISDALGRSGKPLSPPAVSAILRQEGFARLPRRRDDERPGAARVQRGGRG